jgi:hypothetical protein
MNGRNRKHNTGYPRGFVGIYAQGEGENAPVAFYDFQEFKIVRDYRASIVERKEFQRWAKAEGYEFRGLIPKDCVRLLIKRGREAQGE